MLFKDNLTTKQPERVQTTENHSDDKSITHFEWHKVTPNTTKRQKAYK